MSKRPLVLACAAASMLVACSSIPNGTVVPGTGARFVPQVVDSVDNVGLGNAISLDKDGVPYISYWGFPAVLKPGEIPPSRPIGSPFIPAVQVSSQSKDGIWTRGAAAESEFNGVSDVQAGINIPYGPVTLKSLADASVANTNGTDIAVAADGTKHVVWTARDGVYYGTEPSGGSFTVERIFSFGVALDVAGPIGRASVAVDAFGTPWVAYAVNGAQQEVSVATLDANEKWQTSVVAMLPQCGGCPQPGVTGIGITDKGDPVVAYVDGKTKAVVATLANGAWATQTVASGVTGGLSLAVGKSGSMYITYYKSDGTIELVSDTGSGWATAKVGSAAPPPAPEPTAVPSSTPAPTAAPSPSPTPTSSAGSSTTPTPTSSPSPVINAPPAPQTTGVAVDDSGKVYVTWYDGDSDAVELATTGDGKTFTPIQTTGTNGGRYPALAVAPDGSSIYLTWYDNALQDLLLGIWGNQPSYQIAYPSPTPPPGQIPTQTTPSATCGSDKKPILAITAQGTAWSTACLVAAAGQPFTIDVDNKDPVSATGPHDLAIYKTAADVPNAIAKTDPISGPATAKLDVGSLAPGSYYFQCDFHPTLMTGTLVVVAGVK